MRSSHRPLNPGDRSFQPPIMPMPKEKTTKHKEDKPSSQQDQPKYEDLLGGDLLGLFRTTVTGRMLDCNQALADLLGYGTIGELMKVPVKGLYFDIGERQRFIERLKEKKRLNNYEILLKHRNGRAVHVLESVLIREESGRSSVIEGVVIDITSVRQAEMEQRVLANNYRQLTERVRDGILIIQDGKAVFANPAAETLLAPAFSLGMQLGELIEAEDASAMQELLRSVSEGSTLEGVRIHFNRKKEPPRPLMVYAAATWYMNGPAVQLTLHDVEAERHLLQERLRAKMAEEMNDVLRQEIAEHKRTQEELVKSRRLSRSLIDSSLDMIVGVDPKGRITEFNPAAVIKFGCEAEDMIGKNSRILYADQEGFDRIQQEMARYGAYAGEVRNITADGRVFISFLAASRLFDEDGKLIGSMGVSRDVTQAQRDQEALRESEKRYRDLVDNANDLIHSMGTDGKILFANNAWRKTLGYTSEDLAKLTVFDLLAPEEKDTARDWLKNLTDPVNTAPWKSIFITKDGRQLLLEGTSTVRSEGGRIMAIRSILRDITAVHAAQEQLLKHAAKEKALFEASEHLFWTVDRRIALTSFNQGYKNMVERMHGTTPQINNNPSTPRALFAPEDYHNFWKTKYDEVFSGKTVRFETDRIDRNGERVCNEIYLSPVLDRDGVVVEAFGIGHEVTAERVAEARVREQAAKLNAIFDSSATVMIWSLDRDFRITASNKHFMRVLKQSLGREVHVGDSLREPFLDHIPKELDEEMLEMYNAAFSGKPRHHEACMMLYDGTLMWAELFISPIITDGVIHEVSCMAHDITEKKKAEQDMMVNLREKEVLLKEVHHRVKNNLQIISSIFSLQRDHVGGDPRSLALLLESRNRIHSMSFIHESLYQNKNFNQVDFAHYVQGLCQNLVMSYSLSGKVRLHTQLQHIMMDLDKAIPCGLILNELISNALKHAFPGEMEGTINVDLSESGKSIQIKLEDDGTGFPKDYNEESDRGLGMELVQMLIEQLDGQVEKSSPNGATGTAYLITFERS